MQDFAQLYNLKVQDFAHLPMRKVQDVAHLRCNSLHFCALKNAIFQNVRCSHYMQAYIAIFSSLRGYDGGHPNTDLSNMTKSIFLDSLLQEVGYKQLSPCLSGVL